MLYPDGNEQIVNIYSVKKACNVNTGDEEIIIEYSSYDDNDNISYASIVNVLGKWYLNTDYSEYNDYAFSFEKTNSIIDKLPDKLEPYDPDKIYEDDSYVYFVINNLINFIKEKNSLLLNNVTIKKLIGLIEQQLEICYKNISNNKSEWELMYLLEATMIRNISKNLDNSTNLIDTLRRTLVMYRNISRKDNFENRQKKVLDIIKRLRVMALYSGRNLDFLIYSLNNISIVSMDDELFIKYVSELKSFIDVYYDNTLMSKKNTVGFESRLLLIVSKYKNLFIDKYKNKKVEDEALVIYKPIEKIILTDEKKDNISMVDENMRKDSLVIKHPDGEKENANTSIVDESKNDDRAIILETLEDEILLPNCDEEAIIKVSELPIEIQHQSKTVSKKDMLVYQYNFGKGSFTPTKIKVDDGDLKKIFIVVNSDYFKNNRYGDKFRSFITDNSSYVDSILLVRFYQSVIDYNSSMYSMIEKYLEFMFHSNRKQMKPLYFTDKYGNLTICYFSMCDELDKYNDVLPSYEIDVELTDDVSFSQDEILVKAFNGGIKGEYTLYTNDEIYYGKDLDIRNNSPKR